MTQQRVAVKPGEGGLPAPSSTRLLLERDCRPNSHLTARNLDPNSSWTVNSAFPTLPQRLFPHARSASPSSRFRMAGYAAIDRVCDYMDSVGSGAVNVVSDVAPGYLKPLIAGAPLLPVGPAPPAVIDDLRRYRGGTEGGGGMEYHRGGFRQGNHARVSAAVA